MFCIYSEFTKSKNRYDMTIKTVLIYVEDNEQEWINETPFSPPVLDESRFRLYQININTFKSEFYFFNTLHSNVS